MINGPTGSIHYFEGVSAFRVRRDYPMKYFADGNILLNGNSGQIAVSVRLADDGDSCFISRCSYGTQQSGSIALASPEPHLHT